MNTQHPETSVVLVRHGRHDHIECNETSARHNLACNMPPHRDYGRGTVVLCAVCGEFSLNIGHAWRQISQWRGHRLLKRASRRNTLTAQGLEILEGW